MLTEMGRVVGLEVDSVWVETIRRSTCGDCAARKGCGHGLLNRSADGKRAYIRALPGEQPVAHYKIGDEVTISIPEEVILRGSLIVYMLPLAAMLGGAVAAVAAVPGNQDAAAVLGALAGLALGFALVRLHGARHRHDSGFQPLLLGATAPLAEPLPLI